MTSCAEDACSRDDKLFTPGQGTPALAHNDSSSGLDTKSIHSAGNSSMEDDYTASSLVHPSPMDSVASPRDSSSTPISSPMEEDVPMSLSEGKDEEGVVGPSPIKESTTRSCVDPSPMEITATTSSAAADGDNELIGVNELTTNPTIHLAATLSSECEDKKEVNSHKMEECEISLSHHEASSVGANFSSEDDAEMRPVGPCTRTRQGSEVRERSSDACRSQESLPKRRRKEDDRSPSQALSREQTGESLPSISSTCVNSRNASPSSKEGGIYNAFNLSPRDQRGASSASSTSVEDTSLPAHLTTTTTTTTTSTLDGADYGDTTRKASHDVEQQQERQREHSQQQQHHKPEREHELAEDEDPQYEPPLIQELNQQHQHQYEEHAEHPHQQEEHQYGEHHEQHDQHPHQQHEQQYDAHEGHEHQNQTQTIIDEERYANYPHGLLNLGNTCYFNAALQALRSLREFVDFFTSNPPKEISSLYAETLQTIESISDKSNMITTNPEKLRNIIGENAPEFATSRQQDAHEFFLEYVNQLEEKMDKECDMISTKKYFDCEVAACLECMTCNYKRKKTEFFRDFSLDFVITPQHYEAQEAANTISTVDELPSGTSVSDPSSAPSAQHRARTNHDEGPDEEGRDKSTHSPMGEIESENRENENRENSSTYKKNDGEESDYDTQPIQHQHQITPPGSSSNSRSQSPSRSQERGEQQQEDKSQSSSSSSSHNHSSGSMDKRDLSPCSGGGVMRTTTTCASSSQKSDVCTEEADAAAASDRATSTRGCDDDRRGLDDVRCTGEEGGEGGEMVEEKREEEESGDMEQRGGDESGEDTRNVVEETQPSISSTLPVTSSPPPSTNYDISTLFDQFFQPERLEYRCEKCKSTEILMQREIAEPPKILSLHLKRFLPHPEDFTRYNKILDPVNIPNYFYLSDKRYELRSVVCHEGYAPYSGHYVCWVKEEDEEMKWTLYNDSVVHVRQEFPEEIREKAYLVFYVETEDEPECY